MTRTDLARSIRAARAERDAFLKALAPVTVPGVEILRAKVREAYTARVAECREAAHLEAWIVVCEVRSPGSIGPFWPSEPVTVRTSSKSEACHVATAVLARSHEVRMPISVYASHETFRPMPRHCR